MKIKNRERKIGEVLRRRGCGEGSDMRLRGRDSLLRCQGQRKNLDEAVLHNKSLVKANTKLQCRINSTCLREK